MGRGHSVCFGGCVARCVSISGGSRWRSDGNNHTVAYESFIGVRSTVFGEISIAVGVVVCHVLITVACSPIAQHDIVFIACIIRFAAAPVRVTRGCSSVRAAYPHKRPFSGLVSQPNPGLIGDINARINVVCFGTRREGDEVPGTTHVGCCRCTRHRVEKRRLSVDPTIKVTSRRKIGIVAIIRRNIDTQCDHLSSRRRNTNRPECCSNVRRIPCKVDTCLIGPARRTIQASQPSGRAHTQQCPRRHTNTDRCEERTSGEPR